MSRFVHGALWIGLALTLVFIIHYYMWARLVRDPAWPAPWQQWATVALLAVAVAMPIILVAARLWRGSTPSVLVWGGFIWMGFMWLLLATIFGSDLLRHALGLAAYALGDEPLSPERRLLFARVLGGGSAAMATLAGAVALRQGLSGPKIEHVPIVLKRLPEKLEGLRIVQISDLHVGPTIGKSQVKDLVRRTNELNADIIAITGDLIDGSVAQLQEAIRPLGELRATYGVYFVTGNHEYYSGADDWLRFLSSLDIRVLRNERVAIGDQDSNGPGLDLAGVDDHKAHGEGHGANYENALGSRNPQREVVLLAHQPIAIHQAHKYDVGLQLSGHTHGGQLWPFGWLVHIAQPYLKGLYRHSDNTQIYVSPGTGYWGPPMRLGADAELTCITLRCAS